MIEFKFEVFKYSCMFLISIFILAMGTSVAYSHPGRTASDGCHYCRTNCEKWGGASYGERHCHRSKGIPQPSEPIRSHRDGTFEVWEEYKVPTKKVPTQNVLDVNIPVSDNLELPEENIEENNALQEASLSEIRSFLEMIILEILSRYNLRVE